MSAPTNTAFGNASPGETTPKESNGRSSGVLSGRGYGGSCSGSIGQAIGQNSFAKICCRSSQAVEIGFQVVVCGLSPGNGGLETVSTNAFT